MLFYVSASVVEELQQRKEARKASKDKIACFLAAERSK